jgi:hypothetical protein
MLGRILIEAHFNPAPSHEISRSGAGLDRQDIVERSDRCQLGAKRLRITRMQLERTQFGEDDFASDFQPFARIEHRGELLPAKMRSLPPAVSECRIGKKRHAVAFAFNNIERNTFASAPPDRFRAYRSTMPGEQNGAKPMDARFEQAHRTIRSPSRQSAAPHLQSYAILWQVIKSEFPRHYGTRQI